MEETPSLAIVELDYKALPRIFGTVVGTVGVVAKGRLAM